MRQNILYVIFIVMIMSENMFVVVGAFVFGYCLGYYSFELFKYKNRAEEIHQCFLRYKEKYGSQCRRSCEKLKEIKIADDIFLEKICCMNKTF